MQGGGREHQGDGPKQHRCAVEKAQEKEEVRVEQPPTTGRGGGDVYVDKLNLVVQVVLQRVQWSVTPPGEDQNAFVWGSSLHFFEGV